MDKGHIWPQEAAIVCAGKHTDVERASMQSDAQFTCVPQTTLRLIDQCNCKLQPI